ncbi:MAG: M36 family metallopeptidase [Ferruginibacter sp.]
MKKILLFFILLYSVALLKAQNIDNATVIKLVEKNNVAIGLSEESFKDIIISSAYYNKETQTQMVYLMQGYKGLPVYNQMLVLAFKNDQLLSKTGAFIEDIGKATAGASAIPSISAQIAVGDAFNEQKIKLPTLVSTNNSTGGNVINFGKPLKVTENITAELMWLPVEKGTQTTVKLVWQVQVAPKGTDDVWHIRIDAASGKTIDKVNITVYEDFKSHAAKNISSYGSSAVNSSSTFLKTIPQNHIEGNYNDPSTVVGANYLVIPYPFEAPSFTNAAVRSNPWTAATGNASTLGWHSIGITDYTITRGNNVWASEDTIATNQNTGLPATSSTSPNPLNFNFTPNYGVEPSRNNTMQQFCITNLFYWSNIVHDVTYQYGFDEVAGNYQVNNLGRGGNGNDDISALAQSGGSGTHIGNNANFLPSVDGSRGRMRMYLFDAISSIILHVNTPASTVGNYSSIESGFSTANKLSAVGPVTAQVIYFNDDATGSTHFACGTPTNSITGKIALIDRGNGGICANPNGVPFTTKVKAAQDAGAVGVIVVNNVSGAPIVMGGTDNTITIPAVMVSQADGAIFAAQLSNNLNVTLSGISGQVLDGDLDAGIISHEYTHGISNRLTGGPATASCLQNAEQGGEGWSDYFGLMLTTNWAVTNTSDGINPRGIGTYVQGQSTTGAGIRNFPYSTSLTVNPLTYANMGTGTIGTEVHNIGEIWCAAIWEMTWAIIQQENSINTNLYNFSLAANGGNSIALKLVLEGMRLQPCSPGYVDARNAILTADKNLYAGRHQCAIWTAFAKRGLGYSASQGSAFSAVDQTAASDLPPAPVIATQPADVSAFVGGNAVFTIAANAPANGAYIFYNWQVSTDGGTTWNDVSPAVITSTLTLTAVTALMNGNKYRCILSEGCASTTSIGGTLIIASSTPVITVPPADTTTCAGSNVTFSITATGPSLTYQWQVNPGSGFVNITNAIPYSGATTNVLLITGVTVAMNNYQYRCIVTGGTSVTSSAATLLVSIGAIAITAQPANTTACSGNNATVTVTATGPGLTYNWQVSTDGGTTFTNVNPVATSSTLTLTGITTAMNNNQYRAVVNGTGACSVSGINSAAAILTVNLSTNVTTQPADAIICTGSNSTFCVVAVGTNLAYQWQVNTAGCGGVGSWVNIASANASCFTVAAATVAMNNFGYRCLVSSDCGLTTTSCATLTVSSAAIFTSQPANATVCPASNITFTSAASGVGVIYQWQVSTNNGVSWADIATQTNAALTLNNVTVAMNGSQYRAVAFSCGPVGTNSNAAILTVNNPVTISIPPANTALCAGANASFSVTASGVGAISYQWQVSTDGGTSWTNLAGATSFTLNINSVTAAMNGNQYRVVLNGTCTVNLNSAAALLSINTPVTITAQPSNTSACQGSVANFSITATGTSITYQWQLSEGGGAFSNLANGLLYTGVTSNTLTLTNISTTLNGNQYRVIASGVPCGDVISNVAILEANPLPLVILTADSYTSVNPAVRASLSANPNPQSGSYTFQWYRNGIRIPSITTATFLATVDDFGSYEVIVTDAKGCSSNKSNAISITDSASNQLFVYPNPSTGSFQVRYFNAGNPVPVTTRSLVIFDSRGRRVYLRSYPVTARYDKMDVNMSNAQHGVYLIELRDANGKRIAKGKVILE